MATVEENLNRIISAKASMKANIEAKGVTVPADALIDTYADLISQISGGSGESTDIKYEKVGIAPEDAAGAEKYMKDCFVGPVLAAKADYERNHSLLPQGLLYAWDNKDIVPYTFYRNSPNIYYIPSFCTHDGVAQTPLNSSANLHYIGLYENRTATSFVIPSTGYYVAKGGDIDKIVLPNCTIDSNLFKMVFEKKVWKIQAKLSAKSLKNNSTIEDIDFMGFKQDPSLNELDMVGTSTLTEQGWLHLADTLTAASGKIILDSGVLSNIPQTVKDAFSAKGWTLEKYVAPPGGGPTVINISQFIKDNNIARGQIQKGTTFEYGSVSLTFDGTKNGVGAYDPELRLYTENRIKIAFLDGSPITSLSIVGAITGATEGSGNGSFDDTKWINGTPATNVEIVQSSGRGSVTEIHINEEKQNPSEGGSETLPEPGGDSWGYPDFGGAEW